MGALEILTPAIDEITIIFVSLYLKILRYASSKFTKVKKLLLNENLISLNLKKFIILENHE